VKSLYEDVKRYYELIGKPKRINFLTILISCFNPRLLPVILIRASAFCGAIHLGFIAKGLSLINFLLFGIEVSSKVKIGMGLFLPHTIGTILGAKSIGKNVTIMHGVTLGAREFDLHYTPALRPIVGDNVFIGAGAKIIGPVTIGDNAKVGANAVVLADVPPSTLAVGVPARIKKLKINKYCELVD